MARMLRFTTLIGTILAAAALALAGCATGGGGTGYGGGASESAAGTWGDTGETTEPSLVLEDDGTLTGTDGCNHLSGEWTEDGDTVTFENVASTLMACADVDTWLSGLATATVDGSTMTVFDQSGDEIGTLPRSG